MEIYNDEVRDSWSHHFVKKKKSDMIVNVVSEEICPDKVASEIPGHNLHPGFNQKV